MLIVTSCLLNSISCQVQSEMEKMNGQRSKIADRNLLFAEEVSSKHPPCRQSGQTFETHTRSQTGRGKDRFGSGAYSVLFTKHEKVQSGRDGYFPRWAIFSPNETMEQIEAGNPAF